MKKIIFLVVCALVANAFDICPKFLDKYHEYNPTIWRFSSGCYSPAKNHSHPSHMAYRADHCHYNNYGLRMILDKTPCPEGCTCGERAPSPYAVCELKSNCRVQYGYIEMNMRVAHIYNYTTKKAGPVNGVASYIGFEQYDVGQAIDFIIETLTAKYPPRHSLVFAVRMLNNDPPYVKFGPIPMNFDPTERFYKYAINWTRDSVDFLVDDKVITHVPSSKFPTPIKPMEFAIHPRPIFAYFTGDVIPVFLDVDYLKYTPLNA
jgi:hypothetical protein